MKTLNTLTSTGCTGNIGIFVDSQAALLSLSSYHTTSKLVELCRSKLSELSSCASVTFIWVPGHSDYLGNEMADEIARAGSALDVSEAKAVDPFLGHIRSGILRHYFNKAKDRWKIAKSTWPAFDMSRTKFLLNRKRSDLSKITAVLTGHWTVGVHAMRLGLPHNSLCRSCKEQSSEESVEHFLCNCPSLGHLRTKTLGEYFIDDLNQIGSASLSGLLHFINHSGWF